MNKCSITNGAGFIGLYSVDQLFTQEQRIVVLDNFSLSNCESCQIFILCWKL